LKKIREKTNKWWMGNIKSRDMGRNLRVVPFWERGLIRSDRTEIIVDPGPSFGAGDHPTTVMALELLEEVVGDSSGLPPSMLDVGTGTGVLAIAARRLGAGKIVAHDIDRAAVVVARRNLRLNGIDCGPMEDDKAGVQLFIGGVDCVKGQFAIVAANLAAPTLLRIKEQLRSRVGKYLVLSGIADPMVRQVLESYSGELVLLRHLSRDEWNSALFIANP
jgi:ribosomal protein L11 methyltransferase